MLCHIVLVLERFFVKSQNLYNSEMQFLSNKNNSLTKNKACTIKAYINLGKIMTVIDRSIHPQDSPPEMKFMRNDGWANLFSSIGKKSRDKSSNNFFSTPDLMFFDDDMMTSLYSYDGLGAKIINRIADDMTRTWFKISGDDEGKIQDELIELNAHNAINQAIKWARLYRGAVVVMFFENDMTPLDQPINPERIKGIKNLRVYSAPKISITTTDIVDDPNSPYFDEVEVFPIRKRNGTVMRVHASRCLVFKGIPAPDYDQSLDFQYRYWGIPVLVQVYERLSNYGVVEKGICSIMQEASIGKYTLKNLASILAQNSSDSLDKIYSRIDIINTSKSVINAVLLDAEESFSRDTINLGGIEGILDYMQMNLSAVTNYPVTILFGRSPAGQNATGEADFQSYYDEISSKQDTWLKMVIQKLIDYIAIYTKVDNPRIVFNPLKETNELQQAQVRKLNTESDMLDMEMGLYMGDQILERRGEVEPDL